MLLSEKCAGEPLRIVFFATHAGLIRYFESVLRSLERNGHEITLVFERERGLGELSAAKNLKRDCPGIGWQFAPQPRLHWAHLASRIRALYDYSRYTHPVYQAAPRQRRRIERRLPPIDVRLVKRLERFGEPAIRALQALLRVVETAIPCQAAIQILRKERPDVVVLSPLVEFASRQVDYVKAARWLGVPSVLGVASWDNLTNKGLMRQVPDLVVVWNEAQEREAVEFHGVRPEAVVSTGAHLFDRWFERAPLSSRKEFCGRFDLDPERPLILYFGSSLFIAPNEVDYAERWVELLRSSRDPILRSVSILFRPHPKNPNPWRHFADSDDSNIALWPQDASPFDGSYDQEYFDSIYHSAAVVGVNTSAMIEAGIVGRPVLNWRGRDYRHSMDGTVHSSHLSRFAGGLVISTEDASEHLDQLSSVLRSDHVEDDKNRRFIAAFVRPHGLDAPATPRFVKALEQAETLHTRRATGQVCVLPIRPFLYLVAHYLTWAVTRRRFWVYALRPLSTILLLSCVIPLQVIIAASAYGVSTADKFGKKWRTARSALRKRRHYYCKVIRGASRRRMRRLRRKARGLRKSERVRLVYRRTAKLIARLR